MATDPIRADVPLRSLESGEEVLRSRLTLMSALEASLEDSRKALLALDLAGIERGTREQVGLIRIFEGMLRREFALASAAKRLAPEGALEVAGTAELHTKIKGSEQRILHALRLQAALLARVRRKLRVLANMLAGPGAVYGPMRAQSSGPRLALGYSRAEKI